jgi:hypothetical protein
MTEKKPLVVFDPITVERQRQGVPPGTFRAHTKVPPAWRALPGVKGGQTNEGPWVEAHGDSHNAAIDELMRVIGRLCVLQHGGMSL